MLLLVWVVPSFFSIFNSISVYSCMGVRHYGHWEREKRLINIIWTRREGRLFLVHTRALNSRIGICPTCWWTKGWLTRISIWTCGQTSRRARAARTRSGHGTRSWDTATTGTPAACDGSSSGCAPAQGTWRPRTTPTACWTGAAHNRRCPCCSPRQNRWKSWSPSQGSLRKSMGTSENNNNVCNPRLRGPDQRGWSRLLACTFSVDIPTTTGTRTEEWTKDDTRAAQWDLTAKLRSACVSFRRTRTVKNNRRREIHGDVASGNIGRTTLFTIYRLCTQTHTHARQWQQFTCYYCFCYYLIYGYQSSSLGNCILTSSRRRLAAAGSVIKRNGCDQDGSNRAPTPHLVIV